MDNKQIVVERTRVQVGHQIFEIPSEKVPQLLGMLEGWKNSIRILEAGQGKPQGGWNGRTLLNG